MNIDLNPPALLKKDEIIIRPMGSGDADGLMALMNTGHTNLPRSNASIVRAIFLRQTKDDFRFVAVCASEIIGQVCFRSSSQQTAILTVNVHENYRRNGIATALLEHILIASKQLSKWNYIEVDVFRDNQAAIRLYEKCGFKIKSRRMDQEGCEILCMSKFIK